MLIGKKTMKQRTVEIIVCESYRNDSGSWYIFDVVVPREMDQESAEQLAMDIAESKINPENMIAHIGIYCYWTEEMMEELEEALA